MLNRLKAMFDDRAADGQGDEGRAARSRNRRHGADELTFAAAALLMEAARMDDSVGPDERRHIRTLAIDRFKLTPAEADELMRVAEQETSGAAHHYDYVRVIVDACPPDERIWIIEMLWEIAYVDGRLHPLEANLLRRIGGLLYVSDVDRGAARKRVLARMGLPDDAGL